MSKKEIKARKQAELLRKSRRKTIVLAVVAAALLLTAAAIFAPRLRARAAQPAPTPTPEYGERARSLMEKSAALRAAALSSETGAEKISGLGYVTFLSICSGEERAMVLGGVGDTPEAAWSAAESRCCDYADSADYDVQWLKADLVYQSRLVSPEDLSELLEADGDDYFRWGLSLDAGYTKALLEGELNGCGIYDYETNSLDAEALNARLLARGGEAAEIPAQLRIFRTLGWFMDGDGAVYALADDEDQGGWRVVDGVDADMALELTRSTAGYVIRQMDENGSFRYGVYPCTGEEIEGYSSLLHASAVWSLELMYRATGDETLLPTLERAVKRLISYILVSDAGEAYLYEPEWGELKTGGAGAAIVALTEFADITGDEQYLLAAQALGRGLLTMQDPKTGQFRHILDLYLRPVEPLAERYYDGASVFGLCRLYGADGDPKWLSAARLSMDYMIKEDYVRYADQWASYAANELTKYLGDERYFTFGLENALRNLGRINAAEAAEPEYMELLMASFELYGRALDSGAPLPEGFDAGALADAARSLALGMLDGYFFPERAMYMEKPTETLDAFVLWDGGCRARIDDIQHNICAYYFYWKNYGALLEAGMTAGE